MSHNQDTRGENIRYSRIVVRGFSMILLMMVTILLLAGQIFYWQGLVFSGTIFLLVLISYKAFYNKTELIKERIKPKPGTKWWGKVFYAFFIPSYSAIIIIISLDAGRFQ